MLCDQLRQCGAPGGCESEFIRIAVGEVAAGILPSLDEIKVEENAVTLIVLERPAQQLPPDFVAWWNGLDRQNRVLVLTADMNAVGSLRSLARQMRAIGIVQKALRARGENASAQLKEVGTIEAPATASTGCAVRDPQIPIDRVRPKQRPFCPRFPPWEAFGRRPIRERSRAM
jgi:hypothetical protein